MNRLNFLKGKTLRDAIISGANHIANNRQQVDALNVFPVPDGDTGTNMSMTISAAKRELERLDDDATIEEVSKTAASALLRGARGNSGVILSLLFRGFSKGLAGKNTAAPADIANALSLGVEAAYKAVMKPTEGTILTVSRAAAEKAGAEFRFNMSVEKLTQKNGKICGATLNGKEENFDSVILACGGMSYPSTGSDGNGYRLAASVGHKIIEPVPALVGFKAENTAALSGLTLKNVKLSYAENGKTVYSQFGEALFTHEGISGPAALTLSSLAARKDVNGSELVFDLKPALDADMLDKRVLRDFDEGKNKDLGNVLTALMPKALIPFVAEQAGLKEDKKVNSISSKERKKLVEVIKNLKFAVKGFCAHDSAIITAGGVDVKEINTNTMESKLVENLYFCGEMTDVDALTGGFNMQIAFSTGFLAGKLKGVKA